MHQHLFHSPVEAGQRQIQASPLNGHHPNPNLLDHFRGQHFLLLATSQTVKVGLERMLDEGCPVALVVENDKVLGVVDASVVSATIVGQPASWAQTIGSVAQKAPLLPVSASASQLESALKNAPGILVLIDAQEKPVKVITRTDWLRYLNVTRNTAVFNPLPLSDKPNVKSKA